MRASTKGSRQILNQSLSLAGAVLVALILGFYSCPWMDLHRAMFWGQPIRAHFHPPSDLQIRSRG